MAEKEFQYKLTLASEADTSGIEKAAEAQKDLNAEVSKGGFSGQSEGTKAYQESLKETAEAALETATTHEEATEAVTEYVKAADKATEAIEGEAKAAEKLGQQIGDIRALQQAQILSEFSRGLESMSRAAKKNGLPELSKDLDTAATGMKVATTIIQGGLGMKQLIVQIGGVRAALSATMAFLTGPVGIALIAAAGGFALLQAAIKRSSDEMDDFAEKAAKPVLYGAEAAEASVAAINSTIEALDAAIAKMNELIKLKERDLAISKQKANQELARVDAKAAVDSAKVDEDQRTGKITDAEAIEKKAAIAQKSAERRHAIAKKVREEEKKTASEQANAAVRAAEAAENERKKLDQAANDRATKFSPEEQKKLGDLNREADKTRRDINIGKEAGTPTGIGKNRLKKINEERDSLIKGAVNRGKVFVSPEDQKRLNEKDKEIKNLNDEVDKLTERAAEVRRRLDSEQNIADTRLESGSQIRGLKTKGRAEDSREKTKKDAERKAALEKGIADREDERKSNVSEAAEKQLPALGKRALAAAKSAGASPKWLDEFSLVIAQMEDGVSNGESSAFDAMMGKLLNSMLAQNRGSQADRERIRQIDAKVDKAIKQMKLNR